MVPLLAVSKKLKISLAQMDLSFIPILYKPYMKLVSLQTLKYETDNTVEFLIRQPKIIGLHNEY